MLTNLATTGRSSCRRPARVVDVDHKILPEVLSGISGSAEGQLPKAVANTFSSLYGFRGAAQGVAHGGANGGIVTAAIAEYALGVTACQILLLIDFAEQRNTPTPF